MEHSHSSSADERDIGALHSPENEHERAGNVIHMMTGVVVHHGTNTNEEEGATTISAHRSHPVVVVPPSTAAAAADVLEIHATSQDDDHDDESDYPTPSSPLQPTADVDRRSPRATGGANSNSVSDNSSSVPWSRHAFKRNAWKLRYERDDVEREFCYRRYEGRVPVLVSLCFMCGVACIILVYILDSDNSAGSLAPYLQTIGVVSFIVSLITLAWMRFSSAANFMSIALNSSSTSRLEDDRQRFAGAEGTTSNSSDKADGAAPSAAAAKGGLCPLLRLSGMSDVLKQQQSAAYTRETTRLKSMLEFFAIDKRSFVLWYERFCMILAVCLAVACASQYYIMRSCKMHAPKEWSTKDPNPCVAFVPMLAIICEITICVVVAPRAQLTIPLMGLCVLCMYLPRAGPDAKLNTASALTVDIIIQIVFLVQLSAVSIFHDLTARTLFEHSVLVDVELGEALLLREELDDILQSVFPDRDILEKIIHREPVVHECPNGAVCTFEVRDYLRWSTTMLPADTINTLGYLYVMFDRAALELQVQCIKAIGDRFSASCGVVHHPGDAPPPISDATLQLCRFAFRQMKILSSLNRKLQHVLQPLHGAVALHVGPLVGVMLGSKHAMSYELVGPTMGLLHLMTNTVLVDEITMSSAAADAVMSAIKQLTDNSHGSASQQPLAGCLSAVASFREFVIEDDLEPLELHSEGIFSSFPACITTAKLKPFTQHNVQRAAAARLKQQQQATHQLQKSLSSGDAAAVGGDGAFSSTAVASPSPTSMALQLDQQAAVDSAGSANNLGLTSRFRRVSVISEQTDGTTTVSRPPLGSSGAGGGDTSATDAWICEAQKLRYDAMLHIVRSKSRSSRLREKRRLLLPNNRWVLSSNNNNNNNNNSSSNVHSTDDASPETTPPLAPRDPPPGPQTDVCYGDFDIAAIMSAEPSTAGITSATMLSSPPNPLVASGGGGITTSSDLQSIHSAHGDIVPEGQPTRGGGVLSSDDGKSVNGASNEYGGGSEFRVAVTGGAQRRNGFGRDFFSRFLARLRPDLEPYDSDPTNLAAEDRVGGAGGGCVDRSLLFSKLVTDNYLCMSYLLKRNSSHDKTSSWISLFLSEIYASIRRVCHPFHDEAIAAAYDSFILSRNRIGRLLAYSLHASFFTIALVLALIDFKSVTKKLLDNTVVSPPTDAGKQISNSAGLYLGLFNIIVSLIRISGGTMFFVTNNTKPSSTTAAQRTTTTSTMSPSTTATTTTTNDDDEEYPQRTREDAANSTNSNKNTASPVGVTYPQDLLLMTCLCMLSTLAFALLPRGGLMSNGPLFLFLHHVVVVYLITARSAHMVASMVLNTGFYIICYVVIQPDDGEDRWYIVFVCLFAAAVFTIVRELKQVHRFELLCVHRALHLVSEEEFALRRHIFSMLLPPCLRAGQVLLQVLEHKRSLMTFSLTGTSTVLPPIRTHHADICTLCVRLDGVMSPFDASPVVMIRRLDQLLDLIECSVYDANEFVICSSSDLPQADSRSVETGNRRRNAAAKQREGDEEGVDNGGEDTPNTLMVEPLSCMNIAGDVMLFAGPLSMEHDNGGDDRPRDNGEGASSVAKYDKALQQSMKVCLLACAQLLHSGESSSAAPRVTAMACFGSGYSTVLGSHGVSASLMGAVARQGSALLHAAPASFIGCSSQFRDALVANALEAGDVAPGLCLASAALRWRTRGVGSSMVHPFSLSKVSPVPL